MSEAEDVLQSIDQLRRDLSGYHGQLKAHNDLARHCENQRKRIGELEGLYSKAKAEIAELREQTRWMEQTDSRWEAAVRDCEQAKAENEKLRELVRFMWVADYAGHFSTLPEHQEHQAAVLQHMCELGVEVQPWANA